MFVDGNGKLEPSIFCMLQIKDESARIFLLNMHILWLVYMDIGERAFTQPHHVNTDEYQP